MGYEDLTELTIFSLNTKGFNQLRQDYLADISPFCDILCLQEHWLFEQHLSKVESLLPDFQGHAVSGLNDAEVLTGRPYGGCAILWRRDISHNVTKLHTNSNRLCAIRLKCGNQSIIIVCVYFPSDTGGRFNQVDVEQVLGDVRSLSLTYPNDELAVVGDFNSDTHRNTPMVRFLSAYMNDILSLHTLWNYHNVDFTYESMSVDNVRSTLDHFYVSHGFVLSCKDAGVIHHAHNTSDHSVIYAKFCCDVSKISDNGTVHRKFAPAWHKATYRTRQREF